MSFSDFGNDLYTGKRSIPVIPKRRTFYLVSLVLMAIAIAGLGINKLNLGLEFSGGSEFRVTSTSVPDDYESMAREALGAADDSQGVRVSKLGTGTVRVQTERLGEAESAEVRAELAETFSVPQDRVSATFIGPSWGESVTNQALRALVLFLVLVAAVLAIYFRNWKMAAAALIALAHDLVITVGIYSFSKFEVSPATMIGFLTVLGYSIYDTVVVFDKVRENTTEAFGNGRMSFAQAANLAVNQTLVRSINTTVIGVLPILAVLVVGALFLGPGTLLDLALVLFIGIAVGAYSSIFLATPLLVSMRSKDESVLELDKRAARSQAAKAKKQAVAATASGGVPAEGPGAGADRAVDSDEAATGRPAVSVPMATEESSATITGRQVHKYAQSGPRNQPKRPPKSRRK
ncbi:preprotein translocase subunit SecF [Knoellia sinensis KCTC 19936]|uniref:Protein-export membrane protein SecF n=1 Tax=Knoellia sinensis KCTC 19936 TaxID=1385520 RepID=A0A0A0JCF8_9MICO|nr:protein translocase subunit SecF [Knoellia sinensis]KGN33331.1 preprotein translocase subunit SecF [Knoellia sinensis KCTC 19936]